MDSEFTTVEVVGSLVVVDVVNKAIVVVSAVVLSEVVGTVVEVRVVDSEITTVDVVGSLVVVDVVGEAVVVFCLYSQSCRHCC